MDQREKALKGYEIATNILSETNINAIIFLILFIILIIIAVMVISSISKRLREKYKHLEFEKFSKEKELTESQYKILWEYSTKLGRDPFLALEFKSPFEKVIDLYISENPNFDEELIKDMRKKLGFDYLPYFVPLTTTKDIELFQGGVLKTANGRSINVTLYDKDEQFMYWVVVDSPVTLSSGETVKINFVRKSDAVYMVESQVFDVLRDDGKYILKLPHTFELTRIQRREYPRVECDLDVSIGKKMEGKIEWITGKIVDISPSGARVCIGQEQKSSSDLKIGQVVYIGFSIMEKDIVQESEIVNIYEKQKVVCYGVRFLKIKESVQRDIFEFVKRQQQHLAKLHSKQS